jgi:AcrR family transcriptional regulator
MGRRSDHSRDELHALILSAGADLLAEVGLAGFSAREVARRVGYSIGTIHNVFGNTDGLITAINTRSFGLWAAHLDERLAAAGDGDRIAALVDGYFGFARANTGLWTAIFDHRLPQLSDADHQARGLLTQTVTTEIARALNRPADEKTASLAKSLVAIVHGHTTLSLSPTWALMGESSPEIAALDRVREVLAVQATAGRPPS